MFDEKRAAKFAPRYILGVDYKATYRPMTIDLFELDSANVCDAMHEGNDRFNDEQVWCMCLYEQTDKVEDGYICYREMMISYDRNLWRATPKGDKCCVWYGLRDHQPCFYDQRVIDRG